MKNQIEIYQGNDGQTQIEVKFEDDSVWLTQQQMATLFSQTKQNISLHVNNCFREEELKRETTVKKSLTVQLEGGRNVKRQLEYYNLDVIISVGYRVKSAKGTRFRQWATARLKDYLVQGYSINEKRLAQKNQEVRTLKDGIRILSRAIENKADQSDGLWLRQFAGGLELLDDYDHENLDVKGLTKRSAVYPILEAFILIPQTCYFSVI